MSSPAAAATAAASAAAAAAAASSPSATPLPAGDVALLKELLPGDKTAGKGTVLAGAGAAACDMAAGPQ
jgi:hypothetical protein